MTHTYATKPIYVNYTSTNHILNKWRKPVDIFPEDIFSINNAPSVTPHSPPTTLCTPPPTPTALLPLCIECVRLLLGLSPGHLQTQASYQSSVADANGDRLQASGRSVCVCVCVCVLNETLYILSTSTLNCGWFHMKWPLWVILTISTHTHTHTYTHTYTHFTTHSTLIHLTPTWTKTSDIGLSHISFSRTHTSHRHIALTSLSVPNTHTHTH